MTETVIVNVF